MSFSGKLLSRDATTNFIIIYRWIAYFFFDSFGLYIVVSFEKEYCNALEIESLMSIQYVINKLMKILPNLIKYFLSLISIKKKYLMNS